MTTGETILSDMQLIDLDHRDAQFVRAALIDEIDNAIAAAVQAEHEATDSLYHALKYWMDDGRFLVANCQEQINAINMAEAALNKAAAIRARGEVTK